MGSAIIYGVLWGQQSLMGRYGAALTGLFGASSHSWGAMEQHLWGGGGLGLGISMVWGSVWGGGLYGGYLWGGGLYGGSVWGWEVSMGGLYGVGVCGVGSLWNCWMGVGGWGTL